MGYIELMKLQKQYVTKELNFIKQILMDKINDALDNRDKEEFMKLSKRYNKLEVM